MELNDLIVTLENEGWHKDRNIDEIDITLCRTVGGHRQFVDLRTGPDGDLNVGVGTPDIGSSMKPRYFVVAADSPQQAARLIWATTGALAALIRAEVCREVATGEHALYRRP